MRKYTSRFNAEPRRWISVTAPVWPAARLTPGLAATLGRVAEPDGRRWITARQAPAMATAGGARAMRVPDIGRLEEGCRADIVLYDLNTPECALRAAADDRARGARVGGDDVFAEVLGEFATR